VQQPADFGVGRLARAARALGDDLRRSGDVARGAPALQRLGGAVVRQEIGVQRGDEGAGLGGRQGVRGRRDRRENQRQRDPDPVPQLCLPYKPS
jgi:hypothetical protein